MIKSVHIHNFQSHLDTTIDFSPGLNVLTGPSRNGKSAVLRSLFWAIYNKPNGLSNCSHWIKEKGKLKGETKVTLELDNGTKVSRIRGDINGYQINDDKPLEAVETSVPEEISKILNFSEVNIQKQMDSPFLLSQSSGEVSRFFNRILRLEEADEYQSAIESKRRKCNTDITNVNEIIPILEEDLGNYDWIEKAEILVSKIDNMQKEVNGIEEQNKDIDRCIRDIKDYEEKLEKYSVYGRAEEIVTSIQENLDGIADAKKVSSDLDSIIAGFDKYQKDIDDADIVRPAIKLISKIELLQDDLGEMKQKSNDLDSSIKKMNRLEEEVLDSKNELKEALDQMPDVCPVCGKEM